MKSQTGKPNLRVEFFEMQTESAAVLSALLKVLRAIQNQAINQRLSEENTLHFTHGEKWTSRANPYAHDSGFQAHSVEWVTPFQELVDGDLSLIPRFVAHMSKEFERSLMEMMYTTVDKACEASGNIVDAKELGSLSAGFLEMMRKIEFGVDRDGNVSMPEIHSPNPEKLVHELEAQPPEYHAEVQRVKDEKIQAALTREQERKRKFKSVSAK